MAKIRLQTFYITIVLLLMASAATADSIAFSNEQMTTKPIPADTRVGGLPNGDRDLYVLAFINYTYNLPDGTIVEFSEEKARYGEGRILNVYGHLIHVTKSNDINDHTACTEDIRGNRNQPLPIRGNSWIALIRRGKCTFEEKVRNAYLRGALGAIIYNEQNSENLEKMKIIEKERNITCVFTHKWIGEKMAKAVEESNGVWVSISEGRHIMKPLANINKTSVLFVSISFIILMVISLIWLVFYYIQRFRYLQSKDQHSRHLCTVAKRIIMKIPTKSGKCEDKENESDCCAICIENYKSTDCIRVLPCRHEFHKNCVDPWLLEHRTCPMCKLDVLKHYGFVYMGSEESILQLDLDMTIADDGTIQRILSPVTRNNNQIPRSVTPTLQFNRDEIRNGRERRLSLQSFNFTHRQLSPSRTSSGNQVQNNQHWPTATVEKRSHSSLSRVNYGKENPSNSRSYNSNFLTPDDATFDRLHSSFGSLKRRKRRSKSADFNNRRNGKRAINVFEFDSSFNCQKKSHEGETSKQSKRRTSESDRFSEGASVLGGFHTKTRRGDKSLLVSGSNVTSPSMSSLPNENSCNIRIQIEQVDDTDSEENF